MAIPVSIHAHGTFADYEIAPEKDDTYTARRIRCGILDNYCYPPAITLYKFSGTWKSDSFNRELTASIGEAIDQYIG